MCVAVLRGIKTGCKAIDKALECGIPSGSISLLYGEAETGKTTLATQCAVNCAKEGYKTLFIDCDGVFSVNRFSQIASRRFEELAELIILMRPSSFREQMMIMDRLTDYVTQNTALVVIDTITSLYRLKVAESPEKTFELNRELNRQLGSLAQIVRARKIAILTVSQVHAAFKEEHVSIEPVATRVLKFWADTIVEMKPTEDSRIIKAILEKGSSKTELVTCYLKIDESGIH
jgi:RecA/RadA recombinase